MSDDRLEIEVSLEADDASISRVRAQMSQAVNIDLSPFRASIAQARRDLDGVRKSGELAMSGLRNQGREDIRRTLGELTPVRQRLNEIRTEANNTLTGLRNNNAQRMREDFIRPIQEFRDRITRVRADAAGGTPADQQAAKQQAAVYRLEILALERAARAASDQFRNLYGQTSSQFQAQIQQAERQVRALNQRLDETRTRTRAALQSQAGANRLAERDAVSNVKDKLEEYRQQREAVIQYRQQLKALNGERLSDVEIAFRRQYEELGKARIEALRYRQSLGAVAAGGLSIAQSFLQASENFKAFSTTMTALTGNAEVAAQKLQWMTEVSKDWKFDVTSVRQVGVEMELMRVNSEKFLPVAAAMATAMRKTLPEAATVLNGVLLGNPDSQRQLQYQYGVTAEKIIEFGAAVDNTGKILIEGPGNLTRYRDAVLRALKPMEKALEDSKTSLTTRFTGLQDAVTQIFEKIGTAMAPAASLFLSVGEGFVKLFNQMGEFPISLIANVATLVTSVAALGATVAGTVLIWRTFAQAVFLSTGGFIRLAGSGAKVVTTLSSVSAGLEGAALATQALAGAQEAQAAASATQAAAMGRVGGAAGVSMALLAQTGAVAAAALVVGLAVSNTLESNARKQGEAIESQIKKMVQFRNAVAAVSEKAKTYALDATQEQLEKNKVTTTEILGVVNNTTQAYSAMFNRIKEGEEEIAAIKRLFVRDGGDPQEAAALKARLVAAEAAVEDMKNKVAVKSEQIRNLLKAAFSPTTIINSLKAVDNFLTSGGFDAGLAAIQDRYNALQDGITEGLVTTAKRRKEVLAEVVQDFNTLFADNPQEAAKNAQVLQKYKGELLKARSEAAREFISIRTKELDEASKRGELSKEAEIERLKFLRDYYHEYADQVVEINEKIRQLEAESYQDRIQMAQELFQAQTSVNQAESEIIKRDITQRGYSIGLARQELEALDAKTFALERQNLEMEKQRALRKIGPDDGSPATRKLIDDTEEKFALKLIELDNQRTARKLANEQALQQEAAKRLADEMKLDEARKRVVEAEAADLQRRLQMGEKVQAQLNSRLQALYLEEQTMTRRQYQGQIDQAYQNEARQAQLRQERDAVLQANRLRHAQEIRTQVQSQYKVEIEQQQSVTQMRRIDLETKQRQIDLEKALGKDVRSREISLTRELGELRKQEILQALQAESVEKRGPALLAAKKQAQVELTQAAKDTEQAVRKIQAAYDKSKAPLDELVAKQKELADQIRDLKDQAEKESFGSGGPESMVPESTSDKLFRAKYEKSKVDKEVEIQAKRQLALENKNADPDKELEEARKRLETRGYDSDRIEQILRAKQGSRVDYLRELITNNPQSFGNLKGTALDARVREMLEAQKVKKEDIDAMFKRASGKATSGGDVSGAVDAATKARSAEDERAVSRDALKRDREEMRRKLREENPNASEAEIESMIARKALGGKRPGQDDFYRKEEGGEVTLSNRRDSTFKARPRRDVQKVGPGDLDPGADASLRARKRDETSTGRAKEGDIPDRPNLEPVKGKLGLGDKAEAVIKATGDIHSTLKDIAKTLADRLPSSAGGGPTPGSGSASSTKNRAKSAPTGKVKGGPSGDQKFDSFDSLSNYPNSTP